MTPGEFSSHQLDAENQSPSKNTIPIPMPEFVSQLEAENQSPSTYPIPIPEGVDDAAAIEYLINRVRLVITECAQMGTEPLSTIANVLAQLYQTKALQEMAITAVEIRDILQEIQGGLAELSILESIEKNTRKD